MFNTYFWTEKKTTFHIIKKNHYSTLILIYVEFNDTRVAVPASLVLGVGIGGGLVFLLADIIIVMLIAR